MADLPYPVDEGSTHWVGCYRERRHHNCAVVEVDTLRAENERLRDFVTRLDCECDGYHGYTCGRCAVLRSTPDRALEATDDS